MHRDSGSLHLFAVAVAASLLLAGCAGDDGVRQARPGPVPPSTEAGHRAAQPLPPVRKQPVCVEARAASEEGQASWYGARYHGKPTASGEPFDMEALTAAHPALPFGTPIRVTNLHNGRSVMLVVNDRGPTVKRRIIDVSRRAAADLGFVRDGLAPVRVAPIRCG